MTQNILVFVEYNNGVIANVSLELISKAKELAQELKVKVDAVVLGWNMLDKLGKLGHYGCDNVYYINDKRLAHFTSVPYAKIVSSIIEKYTPQIVLFGATINGRDLAPRIAGTLGCGLTADCINLQIGNYEFKGQKWEKTLLQIRPAFGGNIVATIVSPESSPSMASVREGVMKLAHPNPNKTPQIVMESSNLTDNDYMTEVLEVVQKPKDVNLKEAKIIIGVGIGATDPATLEAIKALANELGAEIGCTRPVADMGLFSWDYQIGQTGLTVRPNLYIACGISGQLQHTVGVEESKRIIAINKDAQAPIFKLAHYGIVGDVKDVVSKMLQAHKASK